MARGRTGWLAMVALAACSTSEPDLVPVEVRIGAGDPGCRPASVRATRLTVQGDFAPEPTDTLELLASDGVRDLTGLRPALRSLHVEVDGAPAFFAVGRSSLEAARASGAIAVLPPGRACALVDPDAIAPEASAVVAHPDGSAWVIGGRGVARRIARIDPRTSFAEVRADALFNPRVGATATVVGADVIVAGGAGSESDSAFDSYERFAADASPAASGPGGRLASPRRDHTTVLVGGTLVLVGGRSGGADDRLLARIDVVDPVAGVGRLGPALAVPRVQPVTIAGADGSITVLGGRDADGNVVSSIERIEPGLARVRELDVSLPPPDLVLDLGLDRALLVSRRSMRVLDLRADPPRITLSSRVTGIVQPIGVATATGRALLVGRDAAGVLTAELWAPHLDTATTLGATRSPTAAVLLADGSVLEIGPDGASLRALDEPGTWSSLPNDRVLLPSELDSPFVATRLPGDHDGAMATRSEAAIALVPVAFGGLTLDVDAEGPHRIVLRGASGDPAVEIAIDAEGNALGPACESSRSPESLVVVRQRERLELVRGEARARCADVSAEALLGVEVVLERGTTVRAIGASRRVR